MKRLPAGFISLVLSDLAGFGLMAGVALLLGLTVHAFRHDPLLLFGSSPPSATTTQPAPEISVASLEDLSAHHTAQIIDARPPAFFAEGHIPGAINLPYEDLKQSPHVPPAALSASKSTPLVVYCSDVSCPAAKSTARILQALGYRNISLFPGGWYVWQRHGLPVETSSP